MNEFELRAMPPEILPRASLSSLAHDKTGRMQRLCLIVTADTVIRVTEGSDGNPREDVFLRTFEFQERQSDQSDTAP